MTRASGARASIPAVNRALLPLALALLLATAAASASAAPEFGPPAGVRLGPVLRLAPAREPGKRMVVSGRLFATDGVTPLAGKHIGVYHTDASGNYGRDPRVPQWARLNGWLVTDPHGRFEIRTIRPGAYPQRNIPEHIHFVIETAHGYDGSQELRFEDDPLVSRADVQTSRREGRFGQVRPVVRDEDGVLRVVRDLKAR